MYIHVNKIVIETIESILSLLCIQRHGESAHSGHPKNLGFLVEQLWQVGTYYTMEVTAKCSFSIANTCAKLESIYIIATANSWHT